MVLELKKSKQSKQQLVSAKVCTYASISVYRKWGKIHCWENFVGEEDYEIKQKENLQMRNILYTNIYLWCAPFLKTTNQVYLSSGQVPRDSIVRHNNDSVSVFLVSSLSDALQFFSNCCLPNASFCVWLLNIISLL